MLWRDWPVQRSTLRIVELLCSFATATALSACFLANAQTNYDLSNAYSTPSTRKTDKLTGALPALASGRHEEIPVETIVGVPVNQTPASTNAPPSEASAAPNQTASTNAAVSTAAFWASTPSPIPTAGERQLEWTKRETAEGPKAPAESTNSQEAAQQSELVVPVKDGPFLLGEIKARILDDSEPQLHKEDLSRVVSTILNAGVVQKIEWLPDSDGYVETDALRGLELRTDFDRSRLEVTIAPGIEQRVRGKLSATSANKVETSASVVPSAEVAGYMNLRAGFGYQSEPFEDEGEFGARLLFDGAVRWKDVVFESGGSFAGEDGNFARSATRAIYDLPADALRFAIGDLSAPTIPLQGSAPILGVSVEKSFGKLQPSKEIRPKGSRSFRIERPSTVNVTVNGSIVQRFNLRPGDYDLDDLSLSVGANDISLQIEDDVGQKRTIEFSLFSSRTLLAPGISEWAVSAGINSHYGSQGHSSLRNFYGDRIYDAESPVLTAFYERGLTADITTSVHFQADPEVMMAGVGVGMQTSLGFWTIDSGISQSAATEPGFTAGVGYEVLNVRSDNGDTRNLRLAADITSAHFAVLGDNAPYNSNKVDLSAVYAQNLPWNISASVAGSYTINRGADADRYGVDIALTRAFGPDVSAALSANFEQALSSSNSGDDQGNSFVAALRFSYRIDQRSGIDVSEEASAEGSRSRLSYRYQQGRGVDSWNAAVDLDRDGPIASRQGEQLNVNGSLGYLGNRAELALSQHTGLVGNESDQFKQRTNLTAATAIAIADSKIAVGRPVSGGFAIVTPHRSLADSKITIGNQHDAARGMADDLGPALVTDISAYSTAQVPYDVDNLPVGYDLGAGVFELLPAYRSGYALTVGSDYTVSVSGALLDEHEQPLALLAGTAREEANGNGPKVTVFTNSAGRFAAQGLRPGRWVLEMGTDPPTRFLLQVPPEAVGLVKLEPLRPEQPQ
jgi:outer membrane usher protein